MDGCTKETRSTRSGLGSERCLGCGGGGLNPRRELRRCTRTGPVVFGPVFSDLVRLPCWCKEPRAGSFWKSRSGTPSLNTRTVSIPQVQKLKQRPRRDEIGSSRDVRVYEGVVCHLQHWA